MRTTLTLDDDILAAARSLARASDQSLGEVISSLARKGLHSTVRVSRNSTGFPVFSVPKGAKPITLEDVKKAEDDW